MPEGHGIWSGTVSFSLVAIPVKLVSAVGGAGGFHLLHTKDHSPLRRRMTCPADGSIVQGADAVRGFEISPGKYVLVSDEELASAAPERSRSIEITEFVGLDEIDPVYYDRPYFLVPEKGGEKSYRLLTEALARTRKAGLARFALHEREYPVLVRSRDGALALETLHYRAEILPEKFGNTGAAASDEAKKAAVVKRINEMTAEFAPEKYGDERRAGLLEMIREKEKGKARVEAPEAGEEPAEEVADLMAALEASMRRTKKSR